MTVKKTILITPHDQRELVNDLKRVAIKYKDCDSLREAISRVIGDFILKNSFDQGKVNLDQLALKDDIEGFKEKVRISELYVVCPKCMGASYCTLCRGEGKVSQSLADAYTINQCLC